MFNDKEAAAAFNELSLYCEANQCRKCIFRCLANVKPLRYSCILEDYRPYKLRAITTGGEIRVVTEEEGLNNEN